MAVKIDKIEELEYNEIVALNIIEKDEDLTSIFKEDNNLPFTLLYRMSKDGTINADIKELIRDVFDKVISTKKTYVSKYLRALNESLEVPETPQAVIEVEAPKPIAKKTAEPKAVKTTKSESILEDEVKVGKLPRRYGKVQILLDIEKQGGHPTDVQLAALALNDLKNLWVGLNNRVINDMLNDVKVLNDVDYRTIKSTVKILENKLKPLLGKK